MFKEYFSWILIALCAIGIWQFNAQQVESEGVIRILTGKDGKESITVLDRVTVDNDAFVFLVFHDI